MAEALSCRAAIAWIKEKAWEKVIVESDRPQLVEAINCGIKMTSQVWGIILDYKDALEDIQTCFLVHVQKQPIRWLMPKLRVHLHHPSDGFSASTMQNLVLQRSIRMKSQDYFQK